MQIELTNLYGLNVYTDRGVRVGQVNDVAIDVNERKVSGIAVGNVNRDLFDIGGERGIIIPHRWIVAVGDIVLVRHMSMRVENEATT
ncbi:photosystem reaction center subunit H [Methanosarcinales archaeon]|uniref:Photosystem reaction center subunit H n=1 Tax=Candidatus Syntropharchaeum caldarium TaxID=1838285 RepID=A0A1F2PD84_9EURY|nr:MAG: photosystem reaction center subunit H [Candidatus Syntrophoarchaeum caldarius]RLG35484.1 MAG: photosystem reaction center subunit H [Methanosarcinales archaeon]